MANTLELGNGKWATGKDTVLAFNDENNNFKPLPFSFSRNSSATVVNKEGLIETVGSGEPRIDFKDNTKGAMLLEPSRTNLITQSESFSNSYWAKARLTATSNSVISPDGTLNASKIFGDGSNSWKYINRNGFSLINQNYYTFSVFAKADTLNYVQLILSGATAENYQNFDLLNGVIGSGSNVFDAKIETFVNGWYKCSMTVLATSTATTDLFIDLADSSTMSRAGSFLTSGGIYIYGAQLEQGSYATSYIPTSGSAVTRVAESCSNENLNVDYSGDYTLYLEHETLSITEYNQFQFRQETSISYIFRVGNSINVGSGLYSATNTIGFNKFALSVGSDGSYSFYKNGSLLSSGSGLNANLETLKGDATGMSIKDIKLYNTRLSNSELQALTSN